MFETSDIIKLKKCVVFEGNEWVWQYDHFLILDMLQHSYLTLHLESGNVEELFSTAGAEKIA